jgi:integrase
VVEKSLNVTVPAGARTLKEAGVLQFPVYCCRHTLASRLTAAGVADLTVAQMIGHSSPGILQVYSKAIDEFHRDAVKKLEDMRADHTPKTSASIQ